MLSIYDDTSARTVLGQPLDPALRTLITDRLHDANILGLSRMTHLVVIEPGDSDSSVLEEIGWSPLTNPVDGARFGDAHFSPFWSWLQNLGGWYELILTVGNAGFAYILLIEDAQTELLAMCRQYGEAEGCGS